MYCKNSKPDLQYGGAVILSQWQFAVLQPKPHLAPKEFVFFIRNTKRNASKMADKTTFDLKRDS